VDRLES